jgi:hypothetical protein
MTELFASASSKSRHAAEAGRRFVPRAVHLLGNVVHLPLEDAERFRARLLGVALLEQRLDVLALRRGEEVRRVVELLDRVVAAVERLSDLLRGVGDLDPENFGQVCATCRASGSASRRSLPSAACA